MIESLYLQDEWKLLSDADRELRFAFRSLSRLHQRALRSSPRVNIVWKPLDGTTVHGGYSRYFSPPPFELVGGEAYRRVPEHDQRTVHSQRLRRLCRRRANYYDVGVQQKFTSTGSPSASIPTTSSRQPHRRGPVRRADHSDAVQLPHGQQYGAEFTLNYATGPALRLRQRWPPQRARGKDIVTSQFNFSTDRSQLHRRSLHLASTTSSSTPASAGVSYLWNDTQSQRGHADGIGPAEDLAVLRYSPRTARHVNIPNGATCPTTPGQSWA